MKQAEIHARNEVKRLIAYIRNYNCFFNENRFLINVCNCSQYGACIQVFPSEFYPWFNADTIDYFRAWTMVTNWSLIVESQNGAVVLTFYNHF